MIYKKTKHNFKINYQLLLLIVSIVLSSYGIFKREVALYTIKQNPDFSVGETPTKICYYGINSIISGKALSQYFSNELFEAHPELVWGICEYFSMKLGLSPMKNIVNA